MTGPDVARRDARGGARWRYHAADARGVEQSGDIEGASERDALEQLRRRGLWVSELTPITLGRVVGTIVTAGAGSLEEGFDRSRGMGDLASSRFTEIAEPLPPNRLLRWYRSATGADRDELAATLRAMSALVEAGVPLDRALGFAATARTPLLRDAFRRIRAAVRSGASLSQASAEEPALPALFAPTIAASEGSGTTGRALAQLAAHTERSTALRRRLQSTLAYPALLAVASIVGVVVIMLVVVPRFALLVSDAGGSLPLSTRILVAVSAAVTRVWWALLLAILTVPFLTATVARDSARRARYHAALLAWPGVGTIVRSRAAAAWCGTLAVALDSGVPLLRAMRLARGTVANGALASGFEAAEREVRDGRPLAGALDGLVAPLTLRLIEAGEATGELAAMAHRAAETADGEVQRAVGTAVSLLEPLLIVGFGGLVGFIALALLQAIYGINATTL